MENWLRMSAADLGRGIGAGEIDPVKLCETYLDAVADHPFAERIYVQVTAMRARTEALAASARSKAGQRLSLLDGVPISWKDLYDTTGDPTASGTLIFKDRVPDADAKVVQNATAAGLVCLGKTHQTEFAFSGLGLNPMTETPPCINDHDAVAGGSSSGAATSVAFGLAAAGIGSDTGGSVRVPSVWNDLVGLKTVAGRLSLDGVVPLCARFDTVGPLARTVEDAALLLSALEGRPSPALTPRSLKGARFAILRTRAFDGIEDAPRLAFENAVARLQTAGASFVDLELPLLEEATSLSATLFPAEAYGTWKTEIDGGEDKMYPPVRERFLIGRSILASDFVAGWQRLDALRALYREQTRQFDAVVLPTSPVQPPKIKALLADEDYFSKVNLAALQNTRIGNLMGLAALTLPIGVPSCGIMFQAAKEEDLLSIGVAAEAALA